MYSTNFFQLHT